MIKRSHSSKQSHKRSAKIENWLTITGKVQEFLARKAGEIFGQLSRPRERMQKRMAVVEKFHSVERSRITAVA